MNKQSQEIDIADPAHWKAWLAVGAIGAGATILIGAALGYGALSVLLLGNDALAFFLIPDYVVFGIGLVQGTRIAIRHFQALWQ